MTLLRSNANLLLFLLIFILTFSATQQSPSTPNYRLPQSFVPSHYELSIFPHLPSQNNQTLEGTEGTFDGSVVIDILCLQTTDTVTLNSQNISIINVTLEQNPQISFKSISEQEQVGMIMLHFDQKLMKTRNYRLRIDFKGYLQEDLLAFYTDSYMEDGQIKYFAVTQFESQYARRAFPCFDEPEYKATFSLQLRHPRDMIVLSNTAILHTETQGAYNLTKFTLTPKMSTYLLAFFIGDFSCVNEQVSDTKQKTVFRACMRKSMVNQGAFAANIGARLLAFYEKKYQVEFPLNKMDLLALSSFNAGAMENWGLITFRENDVLYNELYHAPTQLNEVAMTIAHELAHQWFGDLVTLRWWSDLWLNEGFADFMSYIAVKNVTANLFHTEGQRIVNEMQRSMASDQLSSSHAIHQELSGQTAQIDATADSITYGKVCQFLQDYLLHRQHDNADYKDLVYYLNKHKPISGNLTDYTNRWLLQMGFPMVTITETDEQLQFSQSLFTVGKDKRPPSPFKYEWTIKLYLYIFYEGLEMIGQNMLTIKPNETVVITKPQTASFYALNYFANQFIRTNYEEERNWLRIINSKELKSRKDSAWFIQLLDDAFNLASAGHQDYKYAFCLSDLLNQNTDGQLYAGYLSWTTYLNNMNYINRILESKTADVVEELSTYNMNILDKAWKYVTNETVDHGNRTEYLLVNETLDGIIDADQVRYVYRYIVNNPMAGDSLWDFLNQFWEELHTKSNFISEIVATATANFASETELQKIKDFVATHDNIGILTSVFEHAESRVESNIHWSTEYADQVIGLIEKFNQGQQTSLCREHTE